jgi:hypothetical protein
MVGHEMRQCGVRARVARLKREGKFEDCPGLDNLLDVKVGPWICNPTMVVREDGQKGAGRTYSCGL